MVDACKAQGVPEPEYEVNGGFVSIVFRRATNDDDSVNEGVNGELNGRLNGELNGELNGRLNGRLNQTQQKVYDSIAGNPGIKAKDISARHKIQIDTLYKVIRALTEMNLIEHCGSKKTGGYYPVTQK
jgi:ATP-dependent DNA helicase RecG